jgi:hypothetical protein
VSYKETKKRIGDTMVTSAVRTESAIVDFQDVLDSVKVEGDDLSEPPWENCDGYEHTTRDADEHLNRCHYYDRWARRHKTIELDDDAGLFDYFQEKGASKGVAAELVARDMQRRLAQLAEWYQNGWSWFCVVGEYNGCEDSLFGIDSFEYAEDEIRPEIADNIADQLEQESYTVTGRPDRTPTDDERRAVIRERLHRNLNLFNWKD